MRQAEIYPRNTNYSTHNNELWTHKPPNDRHSYVDYVTTDKIWNKIELSYISETNVNNLYTIEFQNQFEALTNDDESDEAANQLNKIIQ